MSSFERRPFLPLPLSTFPIYTLLGAARKQGPLHDEGLRISLAAAAAQRGRKARQ